MEIPDEYQSLLINGWSLRNVVVSWISSAAYFHSRHTRFLKVFLLQKCQSKRNLCIPPSGTTLSSSYLAHKFIAERFFFSSIRCVIVVRLKWIPSERKTAEIKCERIWSQRTRSLERTMNESQKEHLLKLIIRQLNSQRIDWYFVWLFHLML